ncbi:MAG: hypothetical protein ABIJ09_26610 [Pseudomonadota bacterium]
MTIRSGGIGPKSPKTPRQQVSTRASERRKAAKKGLPAKAQEPTTDAFEIGASQQKLLGRLPTTGSSGDSIPDLRDTVGAAGDRTSQLTNLLSAIDENNTRLGTTFQTLKQSAESVVDSLVRTGFASEQLTTVRPVLDELRAQMSKVRGRIAWNNRRTKLLRSAAHGAMPFDVPTVQRRTSKARQAQGWSRGLGLIAMGGDVVTGLGTGQGITRLQLGAGAGIDRHALGTYLAQVVPQTMVSRFAVSLLEAGKRLQVRAPVSDELRGLHEDVRRGRAGKGLEALAQLSEAGG